MVYQVLWDHKLQIGKDKWVFTQSKYTETRGKEIAERIYQKWQPPRCFYHLTYGHVEALKHHLNHTFFACVDITKFFGTINRTRVTRILKSVFDYQTARDYAKDSVVTVPGNYGQYMLPYGFSQSTLLASLCLEKSKAGIFLKKIDSRQDIKVSAYVDDIIISSNEIDKLEIVFYDLSTALIDSGWGISQEKTQTPSTSVKAFNIRLSHKKLEIMQDRMNRLSYDYSNAISIYVKEGIKNYVRSVNPIQCNAL